MPPNSSTFTTLNLPPTFELPQYMEYFTLKAGPNTDLWRKPPNGETTTAPIIFTTLDHPFVVAEVTVSADWEQEWDQGGLVIFAGADPHTLLTTETAPLRSSRIPHPPCKWVKAGMEFSSGTVNASSVSATADGADWCLSPLAQGQTGPGPGPGPRSGTVIHSLRIKLERVGDALWIWYQVPIASPYAVSPAAVGSTWKKLREVTWFFYGVDDKFGSAGMGSADGLVVEFEDLEIF
ncbi:hypothetical protein N7535_009130 [Penicillium sp. DV-2018c]|nr:hypothetical protein N7535_009130 [Penicillium sp. DV-2018c]